MYLEPYIRGWINNYDKFRITEHNPVFLQLHQKDSVVGTKTVQELQNQYEQSLSLDGQSEEAIPQPVLPMEIWICIMKIMKRTDLYNKSRVMGDYQARFCERLRVKLPCLLDIRSLGVSLKKRHI